MGGGRVGGAGNELIQVVSSRLKRPQTARKSQHTVLDGRTLQRLELARFAAALLLPL